MQFNGASIIPSPIAKKPDKNTPAGTKIRYLVTGKSKAIIIGNITIQLIDVITRFDMTEVTGKTNLGKYTMWIVDLFLVSEVTLACNDLPKHPQTITPIRTQTEYNLSGLPTSIKNRKKYTTVKRAGSITVHP